MNDSEAVLMLLVHFCFYASFQCLSLGETFRFVTHFTFQRLSLPKFCHLISYLSTLKNLHCFNWLKNVPEKKKIKLLFLEKVALSKSLPEKKNKKLNEDVMQVTKNVSQLFMCAKCSSSDVTLGFCEKIDLKLIENSLQRVKLFKNGPSKCYLVHF